MKIQSIRFNRLSIPFKVSFKHASATRASTETIWVKVTANEGFVGFGEGCPRQYVTHENLASAEAFIATHIEDWQANLQSLASLQNWVQAHTADIDNNPAAWTAIEIALLDILGKEQNRSIESLLGLPHLTGQYRYTAVIGDASIAAFQTQLATYQQAGFSDFKIKLSGDLARDQQKVTALKTAGISPSSVRADANNFWHKPNEVIKHFEALYFPFHAIEEPLQAGDYTGMLNVAVSLDTHIILDESLLRADQLGLLGVVAENLPPPWIINLRVSKMGGLLRSLLLLEAARQRSIKVIIGAHVGETSVLSRVALTVASQAKQLLLAQEGAFGTHLLAYDVVATPLMFGKAGVLNLDTPSHFDKSGLGLGAIEQKFDL
ncbi:MAG: enolase C-terminal domain-like protein [Candidatus Nitrotoga sp.]